MALDAARPIAETDLDELVGRMDEAAAAYIRGDIIATSRCSITGTTTR